MDIEEGGYQDWAVDVEPGDANSYPTEDAIEHVYVVVTDKDSGEVYEGKLFLVNPGEQPGSASPEGETLAKVEEAKQKEYFDSLQEERSRELIRHIQQEMRNREFRR
tara:strand:- start:1103 stop:1423 length:321 start_codon:yes stop_codon:yes gene_type:complete